MQSLPFRRTALAAAGLALAMAAVPARADITIGVTMPLSGPGASLGQPARTGLALWPESIDGEKLHVIVLDDAGDPATATKNARRFVDDQADLLVGSIITPATLAVAQVAAEAQVPQLSPAPVELPPGKDTWTFRLAMYQAFYVEALVEHMKRSGVKTVAFLGLSDALGEQHLQALTRQAAAAGLKVVAVERFARGDASVAVQALKVVSAQPDAVLVAASGGGASLPQKALLDRGYKGRIYHGSASVSADFLRLSGKEADGALMVSGPEQVPEQLPATHPARQVGLDFVQRYERQYGAGSRTQFAAHLFDIGQLLGKAVPLALKQAKPGTPAFRQALRDAFETVGEVPTSKGPLRYSATDHWGHGPSARVMLTVKNGAWTYVP